ncbi:MAG TPA: ABC transporter permease, partial [Bacteroidota bacterium]|nr:ABC transporter permease [Bacteroidota bacterium]
MKGRIKAIITKEVRQIKRDKRVLGILIVVPAVLLLINGYAMNFDVQHIRLAVIDQEKSKESRDFAQAFVSSGYFDTVFMLSSSAEATALIDDAKIKAAIVIPTDFSKKMLSGSVVDVQALVDGMDANSATTIVGYMEAITIQYSQKIIMKNA